MVWDWSTKRQSFGLNCDPCMRELYSKNNEPATTWKASTEGYKSSWTLRHLEIGGVFSKRTSSHGDEHARRCLWRKLDKVTKTGKARAKNKQNHTKGPKLNKWSCGVSWFSSRNHSQFSFLTLFLLWRWLRQRWWWWWWRCYYWWWSAGDDRNSKVEKILMMI